MAILMLKNPMQGVVRLLCMAVLSAFILLHSAAAESVQLNAQKIKAGLLYNFLKYTTWEENSLPVRTRKLTVCLFGGDPFDGALDPLQGRTAQQYLIVIKRIDAAEAAGECSLIVFDDSQKRRLPTIMEQLPQKNVLMLSDIEGFLQMGGMVEFSQRGERIRLLINKSALSTAGLIVEGRLLKLSEGEL